MNDLNTFDCLEIYEEEIAVGRKVAKMSKLNRSMATYHIVSGDIIAFQFKIKHLQLKTQPQFGSCHKYLIFHCAQKNQSTS